MTSASATVSTTDTNRKLYITNDCPAAYRTARSPSPTPWGPRPQIHRTKLVNNFTSCTISRRTTGGASAR